MLPHLAFGLAAGEQRFLDVRWADGKAKNISLDGVAIKGAQGSAADLAALAAMIGRFAADASALDRSALSALRAASQARADELSPAARDGTRRLVAQGRHAAACRCVSVAAESWRADPARVLQRQSAWRGSRVARRRNLRAHGARVAAARARDAAWRGRRACRVACDEVDAQRIRSSDAGPSRRGEVRPRLSARLRAARNPLRARNDVDLLFGPGDARGGVGTIHARADDAPAARRRCTSPRARRLRCSSASPAASSDAHAAA